ncbi:MAG: glycerol-3-phosphate dehydrogenase [Flavobacteriaceae bacterium]|nr:MAG: glycerol-3-phosphate dehydrogenase [Flavobacteriaceae bacterium]
MDTSNKPTVGVLSSGSWGTALVKILCENLDTVHWWVRDDYVKGCLQNEKRNPKYLSTIEFDPNKLHLSTDINQIVEASDILVNVIPSIYQKESFEKVTVSMEGKMIYSSVKGIIPSEMKSVGSYLHDTFGIPYDFLGNISGPCHAEEVALEKLSYLTISAQNLSKAKVFADLLDCKFINTTTTDDIWGTEYAAVLKNVYSIACGIAHGLSFGDNFQSILMSNAIREIELFLNALYPMDRDISKSAYLGDLLVTGYSYFSRNRTFGVMIGKGYTVKSAMLEMNMVAEGYYGSDGLNQMVKDNKLKMPIFKAVHDILYREKNPIEIFKKLSDHLD